MVVDWFVAKRQFQAATRMAQVWLESSLGHCFADGISGICFAKNRLVADAATSRLETRFHGCCFGFICNFVFWHFAFMWFAFENILTPFNNLSHL